MRKGQKGFVVKHHAWVCPKCGKKYNHPPAMSGLSYPPECGNHLGKTTVTMVPAVNQKAAA